LEKLLDCPPLIGGILQCVKSAPEVFATGQVLRIPAQMLACDTHSHELSVELVEFGEVLLHAIVDFRYERRCG
jgi:hypothetical protein